MRKTNIDGKHREEKEIEMRRSWKVKEWSMSLDKCILNMLQLDQRQIDILTGRLLGWITWLELSGNTYCIITSSNLSVNDHLALPAAILLLWFPVLTKALRGQGHLHLLESLPPQWVWLPMPEVSTRTVQHLARLCVRKGCGKHPWDSTEVHTLALVLCLAILTQTLPRLPSTLPHCWGLAWKPGLLGHPGNPHWTCSAAVVGALWACGLGAALHALLPPRLPSLTPAWVLSDKICLWETLLSIKGKLVFGMCAGSSGAPGKLLEALQSACWLGCLLGKDQLHFQEERTVHVMFLPSVLKATSTFTVSLEVSENHRNRRFSSIEDLIGYNSCLFVSCEVFLKKNWKHFVDVDTHGLKQLVTSDWAFLCPSLSGTC